MLAHCFFLWLIVTPWMSIFFFTYEIVFILFHKDIVWEDSITDVQKKFLIQYQFTVLKKIINVIKLGAERNILNWQRVFMKNLQLITCSVVKYWNFSPKFEKQTKKCTFTILVCYFTGVLISALKQEKLKMIRWERKKYSYVYL